MLVVVALSKANFLFYVLVVVVTTWILFTPSCVGEGLQNDPWANKIGSNEGTQGTI